MALAATIFKVTLQISDIDRNHYAEHALTLARHPSETDERMMVRMLAFAFHAGEQLRFTKGLCVNDEPDLWQMTLSNDIELWIDVGLPEERRIRKACNRSRRVCLYSYGGRGADLWWQKNRTKLQRFPNLTVFEVPEDASRTLEKMVVRNMQFQCTIQDGTIWLNNSDQSLSISPVVKKSSP